MKKIKFKGGLPVLNPHAAGIDAGSLSHFIAIPDQEGGHDVYEFSTFTPDLERAVELLVSKGITTVAIESTGVYWLTLYLMLEKAGIEPFLVNAKHAKNVTGRKKDDTDAIWLQKLHCCGLLKKSYQPNNDIRDLRTLVRQRERLIKESTAATLRMQKALELMNIKVHSVIRYITGKTGIAIIEAILAGERDPRVFLKYKDPGIECDNETFIKSLYGFWNEQQLFVLSQEYNRYKFIREQIEACDKMIASQLIKQAAVVKDGDISDIEIKWKKTVKKNELPFTACPLLHTIYGVNLCALEGVGELTVLKILSELGNDFSHWDTSNRFTAWLNVSPNTEITGGKVVRSKLMKKTNSAGQAIRQAGSVVSRCKGPLGEYARSIKGRLGRKEGSLATAHKLARIMYAMVTKQQEYNCGTIKKTMERTRQFKIKALEKRLHRLKNAS